MKTMKRPRHRILLGVEGGSFFPRSRKAEERLRAQRNISEPGREWWKYAETPAEGTPPIVEHPESMRPGYQPPEYARAEQGQEFSIPALWTIVDQARRGGGRPPFLVQTLTRPVKDENQALGEIAQFFGIPSAAFQGIGTVERAWTQVIGPMFAEFEAAMNRERPSYIPGSLHFDMTPQYELAVAYYET